MDLEHRAVRPSWQCDRDGVPWPCLEARRALARAYGDDSTRLQRHLVLLLLAAERELAGATTQTLYRRFVVWALAAGEVCRLCGSGQHAALPGVPPRVVPCNKLRRFMAGEEL